MDDDQLVVLEHLIFSSCAYDSVRHGKAKHKGSSFEWHVSPEYETKQVLISYKNGCEWADDCFVDAVPEDLLDCILKEALRCKVHNAPEDLITDAFIEQSNLIHATALEIHTSGDPRTYVLDTYNKHHVGDRDLGEGILVASANQSIGNSSGIQPKVNGETGVGKTHAVKSMTHLCPQNYVFYESLSDQALFYLQADLKRPGLIIFSDDVTLSESLEGTIKRSMSEFQSKTTRRVTVKRGSKWVTEKLEIPERLMWLLTSVDDKGSEQFVNRQLGFGVDDSDGQDKAVVDFEKEKDAAGLEDWPVNEEVSICREIIRMIKEDDTGRPRIFKVKIPFVARIEWLDFKNRRNYSIFSNFVKGFAVLRFMQRETDQEGFLIATEDDFKDAARLYGSRAGLQKLHLTEKEKEFVMAINDNPDREADTLTLMKILNVSQARVGQLAKRLEIKLPMFEIEKRTIYTGDGDSRQHTNKNFYMLHGKLTLDDFGSVVGLRDEPTRSNADEYDSKNEGGFKGLELDLNRLSSSPTVELQELQNGELKQNKEDNNHNINNNIIDNGLKGYIKREQKNSLVSHSPVYSPESCLSPSDSSYSGLQTRHEEKNRECIEPQEETLSWGSNRGKSYLSPTAPIKAPANEGALCNRDFHSRVYDELYALSQDSKRFSSSRALVATIAQSISDADLVGPIDIPEEQEQEKLKRLFLLVGQYIRNDRVLLELAFKLTRGAPLFTVIEFKRSLSE